MAEPDKSSMVHVGKLSKSDPPMFPTPVCHMTPKYPAISFPFPPTTAPVPQCPPFMHQLVCIALSLCYVYPHDPEESKHEGGHGRKKNVRCRVEDIVEFNGAIKPNDYGDGQNYD